MKEFLYFIKWFFLVKILGKKIPFNGAIIINDLCNLSCKHCTVYNKNGTNVSYKQIIKDLELLYSKGIRFLEITGGEPFLYKDKSKNLEDIIKAAKEIGFYKVLLCTNGTFPISTSADYVWVSIDGNKELHDKIRGNTYDKIMKNILESKHKKIYVNFTISKLNYISLEKSVEQVLSNSDIKGILFHFFIPYIHSDNISLNTQIKNVVIKKIFSLKEKYGKKICNTSCALNYLKNENWVKPVWGSLIIYNGKISPCCCRSEIVNKKICENCLSTPASETYAVQNINFLSAWEIFKSFY